MSAVGITLLISLGICLIAGVPIALSMAGASFLALLTSDALPMGLFIQRMYTATDSFPLMAIIFFCIAGELMLQGGISRRLINFALSLLGGLRGSLAMVAVVTCAFFGAISGSAYATVAAIGGIMYPEMVKNGYKEDFTATLMASSGMLGILIPPSIPLVVYGVVAGVSIGDLFLGIISAGILFTVAYCVAAQIVIRKEDMAPLSSNPEKVSFIKSFKEAFWGLMSPVIILGGIYSGVFTATESAIIASVYSLFIGFFVYRELNWKNLIQAMGKSVIAASSIMFIVGGVQLFTWILSYEKIAQALSTFLISLTNSKITFLLIVNVIYLIAGMFIDTTSSVMLIVPLLLPVANYYGVDLLHLGLLTVCNLAVGLITPPFGGNLFVSASVSRVPVNKMYRCIIPFIIAGFTVTLVVTYFPAMTVGLLALLKG